MRDRKRQSRAGAIQSEIEVLLYESGSIRLLQGFAKRFSSTTLKSLQGTECGRDRSRHPRLLFYRQQ